MIYQFKKHLIILVIVLYLSSCTAFKAMQLVNSGVVFPNDYAESVVPFILEGHPILIKARLNNSQKEYSFIFDTGSLTMVNKKVAKELNLPKGIEVEANGTGGKSKRIDLVKLDNIIVGNMEVRDCAVAVTEFTESLFAPNIAGILGSNFFKYFKITIDYQKKEITVSKYTKTIVRQGLDIRIPFKSDMETGFAPVVECKVEKINATAEIDTGFPGIAALPLSLVKKTKAFKLGAVITAQGSMSGGAFGMEEESYALRINEIIIGGLKLSNIPAISHSSESAHILLGNKFLEKYLVILNYPAEEMVIRPRGKPFEINIPSYGIALTKKNKKTIVSGVWKNSKAAKIGIKSGDEVIKVNSIEASTLSIMEMIAMSLDEDKNTFEIEFSKGKGRQKTILHKEMLLPVLK
jgi:predicted aspartyl protease